MGENFSGKLNIDISGGGFRKVQRSVHEHYSENCMYWRLYWNPNGGEDLFYRGKIHRTRPGNITVLSPQTIISRAKTSTSFEHFYIHFNLGMPWDLLNGLFFELNMDENLKKLATGCAANINNDRFAIFKLCALISCCINQINIKETQIPMLDRRVINAIEFIDNNLSKKIDNDLLAEHIAMSRNAFARLFKQQTGLSPQNLIRDKRLDKSRQLLINSDKSIEEIAERCGFCDRHYMTKLFTRKNNISPAAFRRKNQSAKILSRR